MKQQHHQQNRQRVILLLDMDCFYAQCETVRLGLSQSLPLCLIQWNSVLAVNYPARDKFDIRRMDTLQVVREKCDAAAAKAKAKAAKRKSDADGGGGVEGEDVDKSASSTDDRGANSS